MTTAEAAEPALKLTKESPRPRWPDFSILHAKPFPLITYPLPPLIPHNPISILHIALSYIYQFIARPSSHESVYRAYFSPTTRSVHVTDELAVRALWEHGFFGKGSLSRSEPTWLDREKRRKGLLATETTEEITAQRREERKRFKKERARKEREAIEEKLKEEKLTQENSGTATPTAWGRLEGFIGVPVESLAEQFEALVVQETEDPPTPTPIFISEPNDAAEKGITSPVAERSPNGCAEPVKPGLEPAVPPIDNQEHLQLTAPEAFFLIYGLGVIQIYNQPTSDSLSTSSLFTLFRQHSYFPPKPVSSLRPDDPFLLQYIIYHHFRSLGWIVRPGMKFAVDWLLYLRGPVFSHAQFAIIVLPAYGHPFWRSTEDLRRETEKKETKSWWWLHCVNRVQSQVKKTLVLCYVEVPPPGALPSAQLNEEGTKTLNIGGFLKQYKVQELVLKRWIPNRERD